MRRTRIFTRGFWFRVVGISLPLIVVTAILLQRANALSAPAAWRVATAPLLVPLLLYLHTGLHLVVPPLIAIKPRGISIMHGQGHTFIPTDRIDVVRIIAESDARDLLEIAYRDRRRRERVYRVGLHENVCLERLGEVLGPRLQVKDAEAAAA